MHAHKRRASLTKPAAKRKERDCNQGRGEKAPGGEEGGVGVGEEGGVTLNEEFWHRLGY